MWSGAGMGERLGVLESLIREGISPIPTAGGRRASCNALLADPDAPTAVVVMGRAEGLPTITLRAARAAAAAVPGPAAGALPRHRAGRRRRPDAPTATSTSADHLLDGDLLFPAVLGMEAMAQAAAALTGHDRRAGAGGRGVPAADRGPGRRRDHHPGRGRSPTAPDAVQAVIRSSETGFQADHFRATLRYDRPAAGRRRRPCRRPARVLAAGSRPASCTARCCSRATRFQRLLGYRELAAHAAAWPTISNHGRASRGSAGFLPPELVLADPGTRDALMHSIQCCVPDATLLPAGDRAAVPGRPGAVAARCRRGHPARRRALAATATPTSTTSTSATADGALVERWEGLRLQAVRKQDGTGPWLPALLGPYLERRTEPVLAAPRLRVRGAGPTTDAAGHGRRPAGASGPLRRSAGRSAGEPRPALPAGRQAGGRRRARRCPPRTARASPSRWPAAAGRWAATSRWPPTAPTQEWAGPARRRRRTRWPS